MRTVLTNHTNYNARKNFYDLPFKNYRLRRVADVYKLLSHGLFRLTGAVNEHWQNSFWDLDLYHGDLCHFFNGLSFGQRPWVVTYTWALPVWGRPSETNYEKAAQLLASGPCKKIIALSQWAERCQAQVAHQYYPGLSSEIMQKSIVLPPSQPVHFSHIDDKREMGEYTTFSIVGHDFFRKGGKEVLRVFDRLLAKGYPIRLNIVSNLDYGDLPSQSTVEDRDDALCILGKNSGSIQWFKNLPNAAVIELLKDTDVGLLPTYHDTYGHSALEAQSCGCPVISTDIYALPEINNDEMGWFMRTPLKDHEGGVSYIDPRERAKLPEQLEEQLMSIIQTIVSQPSIVRAKGARCLSEIADRRSTAKAAERLEAVYDEALR
jgi:glycosyltransferase involved in cell wall biosynthesis